MFIYEQLYACPKKGQKEVREFSNYTCMQNQRYSYPIPIIIKPIASTNNIRYRTIIPIIPKVLLIVTTQQMSELLVPPLTEHIEP